MYKCRARSRGRVPTMPQEEANPAMPQGEANAGAMFDEQHALTLPIRIVERTPKANRHGEMYLMRTATEHKYILTVTSGMSAQYRAIAQTIKDEIESGTIKTKGCARETLSIILEAERARANAHETQSAAQQT